MKTMYIVDTCGVMEITYLHDFAAWKLICFNQTMLAG